MNSIFRHLARPLQVAALAVLLVAPAMAEGWAGEDRVAVAVERSGPAFIVDASMAVPYSPDLAWAVLTDFDNMAAILGSLTTSRIVARAGDTLVVRQQGVARFGPWSYPFESEREIRLEPKQRILAKNIAGTLKGTESDAMITPLASGVRIDYRARIMPDSLLERMFGAPFLRHQIEAQLRCAAREMARRQAGSDKVSHTPERAERGACLPG